jgi:hypothetical protein
LRSPSLRRMTAQPARIRRVRMTLWLKACCWCAKMLIARCHPFGLVHLPVGQAISCPAGPISFGGLSCGSGGVRRSAARRQRADPASQLRKLNNCRFASLAGCQLIFGDSIVDSGARNTGHSWRLLNSNSQRFQWGLGIGLHLSTSCSFCPFVSGTHQDLAKGGNSVSAY